MIQNHEEELLETSREAMNYAFEYQKARGKHSQALNGLTSLIDKTGLSSDKSAFENKIPKLLGYEKYHDEAQRLIEQLNTSEAEYKSWEIVIKAYLAHTSALQSVIKFHLQGEVNANKESTQRFY